VDRPALTPPEATVDPERLQEQLDRMIADLERRRHRDIRRSFLTAAGLVLLGGVLAAVGLGESAGLTFTAAWFAVLGVFFLGAGVLRVRIDRGDGPRGSVSAGELQGVPATVLRDHPVETRLGAALTGWLIGLFAGWGVLALVGDATAFGVLLLLAGLAFVVPIVRAYRRWGRTGLWLTADVLLLRADGLERWLRWADVRAVVGPRRPGGAVVVLPTRRELLHTREVERRRRLLPVAVVAQHDLSVPTASGPLDPAALRRVLAHFGTPGHADALRRTWSLGDLRALAEQTAWVAGAGDAAAVDEERAGDVRASDVVTGHVAPSAPAPTGVPADDAGRRAALASIRAAALDLGFGEGDVFAVEGFPASLSSEHVDLRLRGTLFEIRYSDLGRESVLARLARVEDARRAFLEAVGREAEYRGYDVPPELLRPRRPRADAAAATIVDEQAWLAAFAHENRERDRAVADPESEVYPDGW
jgi:hypothetical protein